MSSGMTGKFATAGGVASSSTGKFAMMTGQTSDRVPSEYIERRITDARLGEPFLVETSAMVVDFDGHGWLNPDVVIQSNTSLGLNTTTPWLLVKREERGFSVSFQSVRGHRWKLQPKPDPVDGREWIRVVEVKY